MQVCIIIYILIKTSNHRTRVLEPLLYLTFILFFFRLFIPRYLMKIIFYYLALVKRESRSIIKTHPELNPFFSKVCK